MLILLLPLTILFLFLLFVARDSASSPLTNMRLSFVKAILATSVLIFLFTEILSLFSLLTANSVATLWTVSLIVVIGLLFKNKQGLKNFSLQSVSIEKNYKIFMAIALSLIIVPLTFIALYYPPNTPDSMIYHLSRIEHWVVNNNVDHYPTHDARQLFHQPFTEFILLHVRLLSGSDIFYNFVQLLAMLSSLIFFSLLAKLFGLNYKFQLLSSLLGLSIPMGIAQATSTQSDYVSAFFLLSFIYFCLYVVVEKRKKFIPFIAWGALSLGLGVLSKLTVAVFAFPFCLWFLVACWQHYKHHFLKLSFVVVGILVFTNAPFYIRNYRLIGDVQGDVRISQMMTNKTLSITYLASNVIRNSALHFSLPYEFYNKIIDRVVNKIHRMLGIQTNEYPITFLDTKYKTQFIMDEGIAGNFFLGLCIAFAIFYCLLNFRIFFNSRYRFVLWYIASLVAGILIFCALFRWQPWHSRLHLPWFVALVPLVAWFFYEIYKHKDKLYSRFFSYALSSFFLLFGLSFLMSNNHVYRRAFYVIALCAGMWGIALYRKKIREHYVQNLICFLLIFSFPYVYFNTIRPLFLNAPAFLSEREEKYFIALWSDDYSKQYIRGADILHELKINKVAMDLGWEYPLWSMLNKRVKNVEVRSMYSKAYDNKNKNFQRPFEYKALLTVSDATINHYDKSNIVLYESLGPKTQHGSLKLIVFKEGIRL